MKRSYVKRIAWLCPLFAFFSCEQEPPSCIGNDRFVCAAERPVPFEIYQSGSQKEAYFNLDLAKDDYPVVISENGYGTRMLLEIFDEYRSLITSDVFNDDSAFGAHYTLKIN